MKQIALWGKMAFLYFLECIANLLHPTVSSHTVHVACNASLFKQYSSCFKLAENSRHVWSAVSPIWRLSWKTLSSVFMCGTLIVFEHSCLSDASIEVFWCSRANWFAVDTYEVLNMQVSVNIIDQQSVFREVLSQY